MFWKCQEFKELQSQWYDKLRDTGFNDVERLISEDKVYEDWKLHKGVPTVYSDKKPEIRDSLLNYYLLLYQGFSSEADFSNEIERMVMQWFVDGHTGQEIVRLLEAQKIKRHRKTVMFIRRRYELKWGVKKWTPLQLTSTRPKKHTL